MFLYLERSDEGYDINGSIHFSKILPQSTNQNILFHKGRYVVRLQHNPIFRWIPLYFITIYNKQFHDILRKFNFIILPQYIHVFVLFSITIFGTLIYEPKKCISLLNFPFNWTKAFTK